METGQTSSRDKNREETAVEITNGSNQSLQKTCGFAQSKINSNNYSYLAYLVIKQK